MVPIYTFDSPPSHPSPSIELPEVTADDRAYVVYSSGTTGKPKGIECPHRGAVLSYKYRFHKYPYEEGEREACNVFFVWELFRPILKGIRMHVIPDNVIYDPPQLCRFLNAKKITRMLFTPSLLEAVLDTQTPETIRGAFSSFGTIFLCGEVVTYSLLRRIIDILPELQIFVGGPTLATGYINRPELNRSRFVSVPEELQSELGERMYRTGDWGYLLPDSILEICGRCDSLVKIRGYSIEMLAVEAAILELPYVKSCVVVSVGSEGSDKQLAAYAVLNKTVSRKQMRADLKKRLPFYMVPNYFVYLDSLPVVPSSSKIDKHALPAIDMQNDVVEANALPKTATEERLAKVWAEVLSRSVIDIQESFFDLGGHSLMAARLLRKVEDEFGVALSMRDLFATGTVSSMARLIDHNENDVLEQSISLAHQVKIHDYKDNVMDLHLRAFWRSTEWDYRFSRGTVLLTGVTGFIGSHLLVKLLLTSKARVICLIRESTAVSVQSRLETNIEKSGLMTNTVANLLKTRVKAIAGDVALIHLGLTEEDYLFLTYEVDTVVHAAAYVNLIYPYQALHGINVLGTRNILDFCHQNKIKPLHYIRYIVYFIRSQQF
ncbi:unnamed protein product [Gongylonema pulchrum]|uniref:Fatty acid synthase n=1 Tax=Gongylonema pulchrum TaxID=637853 RepID=A0A3P6PI69_9BILA|nr:unnamed protein product [Gongylonema pulchrum]